jgi:small redox-active disulfide protein 2
MEIKVIGSGCSKCKKLLAYVKDAVSEMAIQADVTYVTDMEDIMKTGIMHLPGLIINGKVKVMGRVPSVKEIKLLITDEV